MTFPTPEQMAIFANTEGAISKAECCAIAYVAKQAPAGTCAEMGSHRGKSGTAFAIGVSASDWKKQRSLHMVDPLYDMTNLEVWRHADQGHPDNAWQGAREETFNKTVISTIFEASKLPDGELGIHKVELHGDFSLHAIPELFTKHGPFAYVFLDSDQHQYELVKAECELLRDKMVMGGIIAFHDFNSQFSGVERAYREMLEGGCFQEIGIPWQEINAHIASIGGEWAEPHRNHSWHHCDKEVINFFGAIRRVK